MRGVIEMEVKRDILLDKFYSEGKKKDFIASFVGTVSIEDLNKIIKDISYSDICDHFEYGSDYMDLYHYSDRDLHIIHIITNCACRKYMNPFPANKGTQKIFPCTYIEYKYYWHNNTAKLEFNTISFLYKEITKIIDFIVDDNSFSVINLTVKSGSLNNNNIISNNTVSIDENRYFQKGFNFNNNFYESYSVPSKICKYEISNDTEINKEFFNKASKTYKNISMMI